PLSGLGHDLIVEHSSDVGDATLSISVAHGGGLAIKPAVGGSVRHEHFRIRIGLSQLFSPHAGLATAPRSRDREIFLQSVILFDATAESVHEKSRLPLRQQTVGIV